MFIKYLKKQQEGLCLHNLKVRDDTLRICFWNTNKNIEINKYIVDIMCENNVDIFVLAEYTADFEKLQLQLRNCKYETEKSITVGCDRITILKRKYNMEPGFQNKYCSLQIIDNKYILTCLHLPSKIYAERLKKDIAIRRIIEEIQRYEKLLKIDKTIIVGDVNENPYEKEEIEALLYSHNPDVELADLEEVVQAFSFEERMAAKLRAGKVTEEELKEAGVDVSAYME